MALTKARTNPGKIQACRQIVAELGKSAAGALVRNCGEMKSLMSHRQ